MSLNSCALCSSTCCLCETVAMDRESVSIERTPFDSLRGVKLGGERGEDDESEICLVKLLCTVLFNLLSLRDSRDGSRERFDVLHSTLWEDK